MDKARDTDLLLVDDFSIRTLFELHYTPLVLFARTYVTDVDVARDIVQEIFLNLLESKHRHTSIDNLKSYLYLSVRNRSLKFIRHLNVRDKYSKHVHHFEEPEESYFNKILSEELYAMLIAQVETLPEQCRNVYRLVLEGRKNQEIADMLQISVETVKSHKKTGKSLLISKLKGVARVELPIFMLGL